MKIILIISVILLTVIIVSNFKYILESDEKMKNLFLGKFPIWNLFLILGCGTFTAIVGYVFIKENFWLGITCFIGTTISVLIAIYMFKLSKLNNKKKNT